MGKVSQSAYLAGGGSRLYARSATFNGQSQTALEMVLAAEALTCHNDLLYLTLLPWRQFFDSRGLLRQYRAWCPECFELWKKEDREIYEPLIWTLTLITVCPVHYCMLATVCPACGRKSNALSPVSRPGYCPRCHSWLGTHTEFVAGQHMPSTYDQWVMDNIKGIIAQAPSLGLLPLWGFANEAIRELVKEHHSGNASKFARAFGFERGTVNRWRYDQALPTLLNLLKISFLTNTPLLQLLNTGTFNMMGNRGTEDSVSSSSPTLFRDEHADHRRDFDRNKVKRYLDRVLSGQISPPPTVTSIALTLGYTKKTLYKYFPKQCMMIAAAAKRYRSLQKNELIEQDSLFVTRTMEQLCLEGIYPSYDRIEALAPKKAILRRKEVRNTWRNTMKEMRLWD